MLLGKALNNDLKDKKIGRWTVIERHYNGKGEYWLCECKCGTRRVVYGKRLIEGRSKSCGCLKKEKISQRNMIHGRYGLRIHTTYLNMKSRCYNEKNECYKHYGGRGITMCKEWLENEGAFIDWACKNGYKNELTIDRKDNNGNYEPSNCRWITFKEQGFNKRNNHLLTIGNRTMTLTEWAKECNVSFYGIYHRLNKGLDLEKFLLKERTVII